MAAPRLRINGRRFLVRAVLPVAAVATVLFLLLAPGADARAAQASPTDAVCAPGASQWLTAVTAEPALQVPSDATAVTRTAVQTCDQLPLLGNVSSLDPQVRVTVQFSSEESDEQVVMGMRVAAGTNDWNESDVGPSAGCLVKAINGTVSFLSVRTGDEQTYEITVTRANADGCQLAG